jgi:hypothetical protein
MFLFCWLNPVFCFKIPQSSDAAGLQANGSSQPAAQETPHGSAIFGEDPPVIQQDAQKQ